MVAAGGRGSSAALLVLRRGVDVFYFHDRGLAQEELARARACGPSQQLGSALGRDDGLLACAQGAAKKLHEAVLEAFPEVGGSAAFNLGTALRVPQVRAAIEAGAVRGVPLDKCLGWVAGAADAARHLTSTMTDEVVVALRDALATATATAESGEAGSESTTTATTESGARRARRSAGRRRRRDAQSGSAAKGFIGIRETVENDFADTLAKEYTEEADEHAQYEMPTHENNITKMQKHENVKHPTDLSVNQDVDAPSQPCDPRAPCTMDGREPVVQAEIEELATRVATLELDWQGAQQELHAAIRRATAAEAEGGRRRDGSWHHARAMSARAAQLPETGLMAAPGPCAQRRAAATTTEEDPFCYDGALLEPG